MLPPFGSSLTCYLSSNEPFLSLEFLLSRLLMCLWRCDLIQVLVAGDHGGDSSEELSAALYIYSKKNNFKGLGSETVTVNQVLSFYVLWMH